MKQIFKRIFNNPLWIVVQWLVIINVMLLLIYNNHIKLVLSVLTIGVCWQYCADELITELEKLKREIEERNKSHE